MRLHKIAENPMGICLMTDKKCGFVTIGGAGLGWLVVVLSVFDFKYLISMQKIYSFNGKTYTIKYTWTENQANFI